MADIHIDPNETRLVAVFLAEHWSAFLDHMAAHDIDELRCEDLIRALEGETHG